MRRTLYRLFPALILAVLLSGTGRADVLPLFGTGVDSSNNTLSGGSTDPHFQVSGPGTSSNFIQAIVYSNANLWSQWVPNDAHSAWIGWVDNGTPGNYGTYDYRTTFNLTGYNPATAVLTGQWAADQFGSINLNGNSTGVSVPDGNWNSANAPNLTSFTISTGFVSGVNTLDFIVNMADGFDGLRVRNLQITASAVPEPTSLTMLGLGAIGMLRLARRRRVKAAV
jgi:hypothetical protein